MQIISKDILKLLKKREKSAHKGDFGRVLVIGGNHSMWGAVALASHAALRVGAGIVSVITRKSHAHCITQYTPEVMSHGVDAVNTMDSGMYEFGMRASLLASADVIAIGPGLGHDKWAKELLEIAIGLKKLMVVDADGLNCLSEAPTAYNDWILTPHVGEASILLDRNEDEIEKDRKETVNALQKKYKGVAVLKGDGTLVKGNLPQNQLSICKFGNPGMATAGMGDVLTGVIAGIVAQGVPLYEAAQMGVFVHATAGDMAAKQGERGLIASDLFTHIRNIVG